MKKIVLFDVDGVLINGYNFRPELRQPWDIDIEKDFGINQHKFKNEFIFGIFTEKVLIGEISLEDALSYSLPHLGYNGSPEKFIKYWLENDSHINWDLIEKIKILKNSQAATLYIATNQEHRRASHLMNELNFSEYFQDIFYSAKMGVTKPDFRYFDHICQALGLSEENPPIFFDDTPEVVEAARKYGWEAYEFINYQNLYECPFMKKTL